MALQTLNTIKQWFKTGLKPTQTQFWDTWDSFRHKFDKIPVKEVEGLDELLLSKADKTVLDHHLADKNAHAPQVNTDWNSESGFSQLLNKPEFKTINGESLTGDGDIIIEAGGSQDLQTTLANGNETTNGIMFNDDYYNWLKTSIDSRSIRLTDSNSDMLVAIDSAGVVTRDDSQHVSLNPQGIFFNRDTAESHLRINTSSTGVSTVNLPATEGAEITLTATDDFKTINGESIVGKGNLNIEPQGLKSVLDADPTASYDQSKATLMGDYDNSKYNELIVSDETEKTGIYQLKNQLSFDHTALDSNDIGNITLSEGNIKLTRDKSNNQTVVDIADPVANTQLRFPAKSEEGKTYTIATTEDFKTINGESIVGSGDIAVSGGNGDIPTLQEVLDKDRNATNASINLLSEEGESQTTVHEGGLNISEKTETGFLITDINKLGVSVSKDEETTFANISADELSLNKNLSGNPVKQGIVLNEDSAGTSTIKLPLTSDGDVKTLTTTEDFKTINGESIVGEGNINVSGDISGTPNYLPVINEGGDGVVDSSISISVDNDGSRITTIDSESLEKSGLKFKNLKNAVEYKSSIYGTAFWQGNHDSVIDPYGNLFILSSTNNTVIRITPYESSVFGATLGASASVSSRIAIDKQNNIFVINTNDNNIVKINPYGESSIFCTVNYPAEICVDSTNTIYVSSYSSNNITKITSSGVASTFCTLDETAARLKFDSNNNIFATTLNTINNSQVTTITKILPTGEKINFSSIAEYGFYDIYIDSSNNIFGLVKSNNLVLKILEDGTWSIYGKTGNGPSDLVIDQVGNVFTVNESSSNITKITPDQVSSTIDTPLDYPNQLLINAFGNIFVIGSSQRNVAKISPVFNEKLLTLDSDGNVIKSDKNYLTSDRLKTINGKSIVGEGDITIDGGNGEIPTLQQVLDSGNETENSKVILRAGVTTVGTNIIDGYAVEMRLGDRILVANTSQVALTAGNKGSQLVHEGLKSFDDQGIMNNLNYPYKPFGSYTLATTSDFKTINGQSIVGEGDLNVYVGLKDILDTNSQAVYDNDRNFINLMRGNPYNREVFWRLYDGVNTSFFQTKANVVQFNTYMATSGSSANISTSDGKLKFGENTQSGTSIALGFRDGYGLNTKVYVPAIRENFSNNNTLAISVNNIKADQFGNIDIKLKSYTVSTLPDGTIGDQAYVTDATAPAYLGTLTGGGSVVCPVFYNGTTWVSH
jgi:hypothetical protein